MLIHLTSTAFTEGQPIPAQYTCDGGNVSPPLRWNAHPPNTKSLALIVDDPDAPAHIWVHWVIYNIPAKVTELPPAAPPKADLPDGVKQGINDFGRIGYGGPCPPRGAPHRYFFKLYALDTVLQLRPNVTKDALLNAMQGHILAQGQMMGIYQRMVV